MHPTGDQEVASSIPARVRQLICVEIDHEIFPTVILSLPLIQERQLHKCMHAFVYVPECVRVCMRVCICMCVCMYMRMYVRS